MCTLCKNDYVYIFNKNILNILLNSIYYLIEKNYLNSIIINKLNLKNFFRRNLTL